MLFYPFTETKKVNQMIRNNSMSELQFFAKQISLWRMSPQYKEKVAGELYYHGEQDILKKKRTAIGPNGDLVEVDNLPNNRIVDNQYAKMVDQKANYLLGKPFSIETKSTLYSDLLNEIFDNNFRRKLRNVGVDSLNGAIGWLFFGYDEQGRPSFQRIPQWQMLPFWADDDHTVLDCALRLYTQEVWEGTTRKGVDRVEIFKTDGIWRYIYHNGSLTPDTELGEHDNYFWMGNAEYNWRRIPLVPFKYNAHEITLLHRVKGLQDGINRILSAWEDNMEEDSRNTILVLTEYDGQDLGEFRRNLSQYGAVKVRADGGITTLQIEVNAENYQSILKTFKDKLIENARGFDAKDDRMGNNPNQMNIQSMYADIDLDANGMETEYQAAMEELIWFVNQYLIQTGQGDFTNEAVAITFNRDVLVNESEAITDCQQSMGVISRETIVGQHPWVTDVEEEMARIKAEEQEQLERMDSYSGSFGQGESA